MMIIAVSEIATKINTSSIQTGTSLMNREISAPIKAASIKASIITSTIFFVDFIFDVDLPSSLATPITPSIIFVFTVLFICEIYAC